MLVLPDLIPVLKNEGEGGSKRTSPCSCHTHVGSDGFMIL